MSRTADDLAFAGEIAGTGISDGWNQSGQPAVSVPSAVADVA
jgi:hypothetical protein